jgi:signal peptidase I
MPGCWTPSRCWWTTPGAFFPVLAIVLVVRSFIAEPYKIPSSSMMPNLLIGDFILVNKFAYGLRLPLNNLKVVPIGEPERGDVVVFHFPGHSDNDPNKGENFIKRVIGVPATRWYSRATGLILNGHPGQVREQGVVCWAPWPGRG